MYSIRPLAITSAMLTSSIAEPAAGETAWSAGDLTTGTRRISTTTHKIYEVVASPSTTDDPTVGVLATPATWAEVSPTNKFSMFDNVNNSVSSGNNITVSIVPAIVCNAISGFNITGCSAITVTGVSASAGAIYNESVSMVDNSAVVDFYEYFFEPIITRSEFILTDLPAYNDMTYTVTCTGTGMSIGSLILGTQLYIGKAVDTFDLKNRNFGAVGENTYGNIVLTPGNKAKLVDFNVRIDTAKVNYIFKQLASLEDEATVWYATAEVDDASLVYGFPRDTTITRKVGEYSECKIQIRGLV